ncbi:hypothetical protein [uncultured Mediterranean phage uvMED]|nr:hypothetical protein [uncultured Mediterranean phage uvMED]
MLKIRASQVGKIMTSSRSKGDVLSKTAKSYLEQLAKEELLGVRSEFSSKYTDKGNLVEDDAIALVENWWLGLEFLYKNEEHLSNDYVTGTPDVLTDEVLIDVKSSWNVDTFPMFDKELKNKDYYYQLQTYMWLTGHDVSYLCYCLVDTPKFIIKAEVRKLHKPRYSDIKAIILKHKFNEDTESRRVKTFKVELDLEVIEQIKERIEVCREYYNNLIK